jgi:hypothetical protein
MSPWLNIAKDLCLPGVTVFVYIRQPLTQEGQRAAEDAQTELKPCGTLVKVEVLLPNQGYESAVYLAHVLKVYDNPPLGLAFFHGHGPVAAWHYRCGPFHNRLLAFYVGIILQQRRSAFDTSNRSVEVVYSESGNLTQAVRSFPRLMVTLTSGCVEHGKCFATLFCGSAIPDCEPDNVSWNPKCPESCPSELGSLNMQAYAGCRPHHFHKRHRMHGEERARSAGRTPLYDEKVVEKNRVGYGPCLNIFRKYNILPEYNENHMIEHHGFWSCCNSYLIAGWRVWRQPRVFYQELLDFMLSRHPSNYSAKCLEYTAFVIWGGNVIDEWGLMSYIMIDAASDDEIRTALYK